MFSIKKNAVRHVLVRLNHHPHVDHHPPFNSRTAILYAPKGNPFKRDELYHKTAKKARKKSGVLQKTFTYFHYQKQCHICLISWLKAHKIREAGFLNFYFGPVSLLRSAFTCTTADTALAKTPMCTRSNRIIPKITKRCQVKKG